MGRTTYMDSLKVGVQIIAKAEGPGLVRVINMSGEDSDFSTKLFVRSRCRRQSACTPFPWVAGGKMQGTRSETVAAA